MYLAGLGSYSLADFGISGGHFRLYYQGNIISFTVPLSVC
jgi:hypothetical protein